MHAPGIWGILVLDATVLWRTSEVADPTTGVERVTASTETPVAEPEKKDV